MPPTKNHAAPKPQSLGTRCGKLLNKLEKLEKQRDEKLRNLPGEVERWYDEKRTKALDEADDDVLEKLGLDRG